MKIKKLRKELGWNRSDVERELGIPVRTLQHWEDETRVPSNWVLRLIEAELERRLKNAEK